MWVRSGDRPPLMLGIGRSPPIHSTTLPKPSSRNISFEVMPILGQVFQTDFSGRKYSTHVDPNIESINVESINVEPITVNKPSRVLPPVLALGSQPHYSAAVEARHIHLRVPYKGYSTAPATQPQTEAQR